MSLKELVIEIETKIESVYIDEVLPYDNSRFIELMTHNYDILKKNMHTGCYYISTIFKRKKQQLSDRFPANSEVLWKVCKNEYSKTKINLRYPYTLYFVSNRYLIKYYICIFSLKTTLAIGRCDSAGRGLNIKSLCLQKEGQCIPGIFSNTWMF